MMGKGNETFRILADGSEVSNDTWKTGLNNNDAVIGPSGCGKTRGYVLPNILRGNESMIVADTKGNLMKSAAGELERKGYRVMGIDFTGGPPSCGYNPFDYIRYEEEKGKYSEQDIKTAAAALVPQEDERDPFWHLAARMYLESITAYILECLPREEHCPASVLRLFGAMGTGVFERLFMELSELDPGSYALSLYRMYQGNARAEKMHESIRGILAEKLAVFALDNVKALSGHPQKVDFRSMGREKTALFLTISDTDRSMDRLVNLFYTQALHELLRSADRDYADCRLAVPVRFLLDDFAANVHIPDSGRITSVIRSREVSVSIILQSLTQLEAMYGPAEAKTILNNCDHCLYLGGQDVETARHISFKADKGVSTVLNMPLNEAWLFERGKEPQKVRRYSPAREAGA